MRLVFAGTPDVAVPSLHALVDAGHDIVGVISRPDAPVGRKRVLTPSPVAAAATALGLPTIRAARLDDAASAAVAALEPDLGVVVAYGGLVREPLLSTPVHGWINLHFSLLPRWRGAAPVQRTLIAGDAETGVTVFRLVPELDAGDVLAIVPQSTPAEATATELLAALADTGARVLADVVGAVAAGTAVAAPQRGSVTLAPKLTLADGALDWSADAATVVDRYRGVTSEPGAHTSVAGVRLKIHELRGADSAPALAPGRFGYDAGRVLVGTATTPVELLRVQPAGKPAMAAPDWWRGLRDHDVAADA